MLHKTEDKAKKKPGGSAVTILHFPPRRGACPFLFNHLSILSEAPVHYRGSNCMLHSISNPCLGVVSLLCTQDLTCPLYEAVTRTQSHAGSSPAQGKDWLITKAPPTLPELGFTSVPRMRAITAEPE